MGINHWLRRSVLALSGVALISGSAIAQVGSSGGGLTIFGGVDSEYRLTYNIANNKKRSTRARYYLWVSGRKIPREVLELQISYPEEFEEEGGYFSRASFELRDGNGLRGESIPIEEVVLNSEENIIEIYPEEPIPANTSFTVFVDRVRNPNRYGNHFFILDALYQGGVLRELVGIWPLEVAAVDNTDLE